jgi:hypothetical protein
VLTKDQNIITRQIDNEVILVPIRQKTSELQCIYTTNEIGGRIWQLIDGKRSEADILATILDEYNVTEDEAKSGLQEFIEQLKEIGCIKETEQ